MVSRSVFAAAALAVLARAQTIETSSASSVAASSTVAQSMPPTATQAFNPGLVDEATRFLWCRAQRNTCPQICQGAASTNRCEESSLTYSCICPNGTVPDVTAFIETLPFKICQETYIQCVAAHPNDAQGQQTCEDNEQCGTRNATAEAIAATSAAAAETTAAATSGSAESSAAASGTGSASASAASPSDTGNAASTNTQHIATGAFAALLMAACKLLL